MARERLKAKDAPPGLSRGGHSPTHSPGVRPHLGRLQCWVSDSPGALGCPPRNDSGWVFFHTRELHVGISEQTHSPTGIQELDTRVHVTHWHPTCTIVNNKRKGGYSSHLFYGRIKNPFINIPAKDHKREPQRKKPEEKERKPGKNSPGTISSKSWTLPTTC